MVLRSGAVLEDTADIFDRGGKRPPPEFDEVRVKELHTKIGELAVASEFLSRKLKPWTGIIAIHTEPWVGSTLLPVCFG